MGHIANPRNQLKSINTFAQSYEKYHNINYWKENPIVLFWRIKCSLFVKPWFPLVQMFWRRTFLNLVNVFPLFWYHNPLVNEIVLHLNKLNLFHLRMLCAMFCWYKPCCSRGEDENGKSFQTDRPRTTRKEKFYLLSAEVS